MRLSWNEIRARAVRFAEEYKDDHYERGDLRKAHHDLDAAVDRLYRAKPFEGDRDRVEHLFGLYEKLVAPLTAAANSQPGRTRRKRKTSS